MHHARAAFRPPLYARMMRSSVARWVFVVVLAPLLMLGAFGGTQFLVHVHENHGAHLHALNTFDGRVLPTDGCDAHFGHDHSTADSPVFSCEHGGEEECSLPDGVPVTVPDHEQFSSGGVDLTRSIQLASVLILANMAGPTTPELDRHIGSPGGPLGWRPLHLSALSAGDRIVYTSHALLI